MPAKKPPQNGNRCSFCRRTPEVAGPLVDADNNTAKICKDCAETVLGLIEQHASGKKQKPKKAEPKDISLPSPRFFYDHLNRFVIGQEHAKRRISVGVTNHLKRITDVRLRELNRSMVTHPDVANTVIEKSNMLFLGPTGTGKTLIARSLANFLGVPFAIGDATSLTEAGYVGEDVENLLLKLLRAADWDLEKAERGIIYIDEIDKIRRTGHNVSITRDVSGEGVQQSLLKMIEGTISNVPPQGGRKHPEQQYIEVDTTNILFICGGAFVGLDDIIARRLGKKSIGFGRDTTQQSIEHRNELLRQVEPEDLEEYGLIPELVGRLPVVAPLDELTVADLVRVLREPENAIVKQYRKLFLMDGVDLRFTEDALTLIAEKAKKKKTGARALQSILEDAMMDVMFALPESEKGTLVVTPEVIRGEQPPRLEVQEEAA